MPQEEKIDFTPDIDFVPDESTFVGPVQPEVGTLGKLKQGFDNFVGSRLHQLSGEEPGILNPEPDKNPLLNKSFIEPLPRNQRLAHPELFPNDDRTLIGKTVDSLYDTGAGMINSLFSPLGVYGAVMDANPADMSLEGTGLGVTKPTVRAINGKLEMVKEPAIVPKSELKPLVPKENPFAELQAKVDSHLANLKPNEEVTSPTNIVNSETGALRLRGKKASEVEQIRNQIIKTVSSGGKLNLNDLYQPFSDKISASQFGKIVDDILESGDLQRTYESVRKVNAARNLEPAPSKPSSLSDAISNLKNAVTQHISARQTQDAMVTEEKALRASKLRNLDDTVEGVQQKAQALKGEYPKVPIEPIKEAISQVDLDELMAAPAKVFTDEFQKFRAQQAIGKVFGLTGNNTPLQPNEIKLLQQTFGEEMGNQLAELHGGLALVADANPSLKRVSEVANLAKSMQASFDLSAPLRQGLPLALRGEYYRAFGDMFKSAFSEQHYAGLQDYLNNSWENRDLASKSGLSITKIGNDIGPKEEHFLTSLPEKIPGFGKVFRGSERAYVGFLDKLRADTFDSMIADLKKSGIVTDSTIKLKNGKEILVPSKESKMVAQYINTATGRGRLGAAEKYGDLLNGLFYSPRFQASRIQLVTDPITQWSKLPKVVRDEYLKSLLAVGGFVTTANALGSAMGGKLTLNPTSSDFGKIRVGDKTRVDTGAGFLQYLTLASRLLKNETTSIKGNTTELGEGYRAPDRGDIALRFARSKLAPVPQYALGAFTGKNAIGQPFDTESETAKLVIPLLVQDMYDVVNEDPSLAPLLIPSVFGAGVSVFQNFKKEKKPSISDRLNSLIPK